MANETNETKEAKAREKEEKQESKVGIGKLVLWNTRSVAVAIQTLTLTYLMIYCTDTLHIEPAWASIMLVATKLLDGVTDTVAGFIVDRTQTRWGKGRPYEVSVIGLWLATWLLFSVPTGFGSAAKMVWIFCMYTMANSVFYTLLSANQNVYMIRAFKDTQIVKLTSYGSVITMLVAAAFNILFPTAVTVVATSASGWSSLMLMMAVPLAAIGILRMVFIPERYQVGVAVNGQQEEKLKLRDIATLFKTNKYILIIAMMTLIFNLVCNMGVNTYYYSYIVGNLALAGVAAAAQMIAIPLAFCFPILLSKMSTIRLMFAGFIVAVVGYAINAVAGANMLLLVIAAIFTGAGTIPASMLSSLVILECADFNEWKGNPRMEGTMSSLVGLGSKIGAAVGAGLLGICLSAVGYNGDANITAASNMMIRALFGIVPMILYIITALSLRFYKLDKLTPQIKADIAARRAGNN